MLRAYQNGKLMFIPNPRILLEMQIRFLAAPNISLPE
jgi:hypothetical protein